MRDPLEIMTLPLSVSLSLLIIFISVVFPEPLAPERAMRLPVEIKKLTSFRMSLSPNAREILSSCTKDIV